MTCAAPGPYDRLTVRRSRKGRRYEGSSVVPGRLLGVYGVMGLCDTTGCLDVRGRWRCSDDSSWKKGCQELAAPGCARVIGPTS